MSLIYNCKDLFSISSKIVLKRRRLTHFICINLELINNDGFQVEPNTMSSLRNAGALFSVWESFFRGRWLIWNV